MVVGIIGLGKMGSIHLRTLEDLKRNNLIDDIRTIDEQYTESEFDDFINICDCFVVSTPTEFHKYYCEALMNTGKKILCEKPFIDKLPIDSKFVSYADKGLLRVGYLERFNIIFNRFVEAIDCEVELGDKLLYLEAKRINIFPKYQIKNQEILTDLGVHDFDLMHNMFCYNIKVRDAIIIEDNKRAVFSKVDFICGKSLIPCEYKVSWISAVKRREWVAYLKHKIIYVDLINQKMETVNRVTGRRESTVEVMEPAYLQMKSFLFDEDYLHVDVLGCYAQRVAQEVLDKAERINK